MKHRTLHETVLNVVTLKKPGLRDMQAIEMRHFVKVTTSKAEAMAPLLMSIQDAKTMVEMLLIAIGKAEGNPGTAPSTGGQRIQ